MVTGHGGWVRFGVADVPGDVFVQVARGEGEGDRFRVRAVYVDGRGEDVLASHLRALPLAKLEAQVNSPGNRRAIEANLDVDVDPAGRYLRGGRGAMSDEAMPMPADVPRPRKPRALRVPPASPYPDDFYRRVGDHYVWWSDHGGRPAAAIAGQVDKPVSTVHRWVREARKRGYLPPGRAGVAG